MHDAGHRAFAALAAQLRERPLHAEFARHREAPPSHHVKPRRARGGAMQGPAERNA